MTRFAPAHSTTAAVLAAAVLAGCAGPASTPLPPAADEATVVQRWGAPTGVYTLPGGGKRLEYASGPYGRTTWMVDLDPAGRVQGREQVLTERHLQALQGKLPGMTQAELLRAIGRPGERRSGGWQGGQVWSWRYETFWCLWFQVSVGDDGRVRDGIFGPDPLCDRDGDDKAALWGRQR